MQCGSPTIVRKALHSPGRGHSGVAYCSVGLVAPWRRIPLPLQCNTVASPDQATRPSPLEWKTLTSLRVCPAVSMADELTQGAGCGADRNNVANVAAARRRGGWVVTFPRDQAPSAKHAKSRARAATCWVFRAYFSHCQSYDVVIYTKKRRHRSRSREIVQIMIWINEKGILVSLSSVSEEQLMNSPQLPLRLSRLAQVCSDRDGHKTRGRSPASSWKCRWLLERGNRGRGAEPVPDRAANTHAAASPHTDVFSPQST